jgi:hypothetical protein
MSLIDENMAEQAALDWFENQVDYLFQRVKCNLQEMATLTSLRDRLLPKLLAGRMAIDCNT